MKFRKPHRGCRREFRVASPTWPSRDVFPLPVFFEWEPLQLTAVEGQVGVQSPRADHGISLTITSCFRANVSCDDKSVIANMYSDLGCVRGDVNIDANTNCGGPMKPRRSGFEVYVHCLELLVQLRCQALCQRDVATSTVFPST